MSKSQENEDQVDIGNLRDAIEQERQKRVRLCAQELQALLQKYRCSIIPRVMLEGDRVVSSISIVSNE